MVLGANGPLFSLPNCGAGRARMQENRAAKRTIKNSDDTNFILKGFFDFFVNDFVRDCASKCFWNAFIYNLII